MYLLFVDESGTHGGSHAFVLGGIAIHERDAVRLQREVDKLVIKHLGTTPVNLEEYEIHATELRNAKKPTTFEPSNGASRSLWANVDRQVRIRLLDEAYQLIINYAPVNEKLPQALFGVVMDRQFRASDSVADRERYAYEVLLNKFDVMLKSVNRTGTVQNHGLVIHDRRVVAERDIQAWTSEWRLAAGRVGQLRNLADVPLFADSRATRLLQLADLVAYALYRAYNPATPDVRFFEPIWPVFHRDGTTVHGCIHFSPSFGQGECTCLPCATRFEADAVSRFVRTGKRRAPAVGG